MIQVTSTHISLAKVLWPQLISKGVGKYSPTMFLKINSLTIGNSQTFISSPDLPSELRPLCPTASLTFPRDVLEASQTKPHMTLLEFLSSFLKPIFLCIVSSSQLLMPKILALSLVSIFPSLAYPIHQKMPLAQSSKMYPGPLHLAP